MPRVPGAFFIYDYIKLQIGNVFEIPLYNTHFKIKYPTTSQTRPFMRKNKNPQNPTLFIQVIIDFLFFSAVIIFFNFNGQLPRRF